MDLLIFEPIFEFSRQNCVAICSFLVPANLLTTLLTVILVFTQRPRNGHIVSQTPQSYPPQILLATALSVIFAFTLFLHVSTWFIIGVITPVTFILFGLGATCLAIAILANVYRNRLLAIKLPNREVLWNVSTGKIKKRFN